KSSFFTKPSGEPAFDHFEQVAHRHDIGPIAKPELPLSDIEPILRISLLKPALDQFSIPDMNSKIGGKNDLQLPIEQRSRRMPINRLHQTLERDPKMFTKKIIETPSERFRIRIAQLVRPMPADFLKNARQMHQTARMRQIRRRQWILNCVHLSLSFFKN